MRFLSVLCVLTLGLFSACGDDSNQPEWPAKEVTFSAYHFSCADATTKSPVTDTLRFAALGGSYAYDISFRRERIEGGVATGEEVFDECVEVACDYDELVDAVGYECVEGALE